MNIKANFFKINTRTLISTIVEPPTYIPNILTDRSTLQERINKSLAINNLRKIAEYLRIRRQALVFECVLSVLTFY